MLPHVGRSLLNYSPQTLKVIGGVSFVLLLVELNIVAAGDRASRVWFYPGTLKLHWIYSTDQRYRYRLG